MIGAYEIDPPPEIAEVADWLERVRRNEGLAAAQEAVFRLARRYPDVQELQALALWHRPQWWEPLEFGAIRVEDDEPDPTPAAEPAAADDAEPQTIPETGGTPV